MIKLIHGDCKEEMKKLRNNSVDAIITDPPYHLVSIVKRFGKKSSAPAKKGKDGSFKRLSGGFMGKTWDGVDENGQGIAYNINLWKECLRVLKPGGHLLSFGGTRTYHRMVCAIENAGFEIRDMLEWIYASGFPKSLNVGKKYNQVEQKEWSKIGKALDNIDQKSIIEVWKRNSNNVKFVETQFAKNQTEAGINTQKNNSVLLNVEMFGNQETSSSLNANTVELSFIVPEATSTKINTALQSVEAEIKQLQSNAKFAKKQLQDQNHSQSMSIFTAQCDVKEWLKENTTVSHKADEALKTLRGNKKYSNEEIINVLCAVLTDTLKLTILNQSKIFQNLDTTQKTECVSAINVIITEYTTECLISNTVAILKSKAYDKKMGNKRKVVGKKMTGLGSGKTYAFTDKNNEANKEVEITKGISPWEGFGTALKPAHEPIVLARKPLSEKTIVENCIKWGTGALDIDGCRIPTSDKWEGRKMPDAEDGVTWGGELNKQSSSSHSQGRFPANLLVTDDALNDGEVTKSTGGKSGHTGAYSGGFKEEYYGDKKPGLGDSGSKSRYFDIDCWTEKHGLIQVPKASKKERNAGCEKLEKKKYQGRWNNAGEWKQMKTLVGKNFHPTCKPVHLMCWLIRLISKNNDTILDPFMGSGTTGVACKKLNRKFIGIEKEKEYYEIAKKRIDGTMESMF